MMERPTWTASLDVDKLTKELARIMAQTVEKRTAKLTKERDDALKEIERLNGELRTLKFGGKR